MACSLVHSNSVPKGLVEWPGKHDCARLIHKLRGKRDVATTNVFAQLVYMHGQNTKKEREGKRLDGIIGKADGYRYFYNTIEDWAFICDDISYEQFRKAKRVLEKELGLAVCRNWRRHIDGAPVTHMRLDIPKVIVAFSNLPAIESRWKSEGKTQITKKGKTQIPTGGKVQIPSVAFLQILSSEITSEIPTENTTERSGVEDNAGAGEIQIQEEERKKEEDLRVATDELVTTDEVVRPPSEDVTMTAKEILAAHTTPILVGKSPTVLWQTLMHDLEGGFQQALTGKQKGQLSQLDKKLKEAPVTLQELLIWLFVPGHWDYFGRTAMDNAGHTTYPDYPNLDYLVKHHGVAVNLLMADLKDHAAPQGFVQLSATILPKGLTQQPMPEPGYQPTEADFLQWKQELDDPGDSTG